MTGLSSFINRLHLLKQIPIFSKLRWLELRKLARKSNLVEYKKGTVLRKEGDPPDYFYCLISGRLQAYSTSKSGQKQDVDFIHRGMHFGIISVLTGESHSMTFEAINDSVVLQISQEDFTAVLKTIPHLAIELSHDLSKRMRSKVKGTKTIFESSIISVYSPVQGTGSSTYAINLALNLEKETRKKVIFVSILSSQKTESSPLHSETTQASPHWKTEAISLNALLGDFEKIKTSIIKNDLPIDLLNVSFDPTDVSAKKQISPLVSILVGDYHYVIVDLPNDMDDVVFETLTQSDRVHLISSDRRKDFELIRHVIDQLEVNLRENFKAEKIKVIVRALHDKIYLSFEEIHKVLDYPVDKTLPFIHQDQLEMDINCKSLHFLRCPPKSEYSKAITQLAREIGGVLVGLVLGGGAALGVAHIGVLRVLEEENIPVDIVVGSSMGALIGGFWASGKSLEEIQNAAAEFHHKVNMLKLFDPVMPISGLIGGRAMKLWLKKHLGHATFYTCKIPFKVVTYDLIRREEIVIEHGSLVEAIRESIAIPGVIEPVRKKDQWIIDGGVLNPLPTNILASRGIKKIIAVNVLQSPEDVSEGYDIEQQERKKKQTVPFLKHPFHYIGFRLGNFFVKPFSPNIADIILRTLQATEYVIAEQSARQADVVIHPDLVGIKWFELDKYKELIKAGEQATRDRLPEIKKLIAE